MFHSEAFCIEVSTFYKNFHLSSSQNNFFYLLWYVKDLLKMPHLYV